MRIAYDNYVDATAVTLIASSEDANYPVENIQDQRLGLTWRTTAITSQSVIVDLGSSRAIDTVAILGHNVSSTATVTLVGSNELNASAWSDWRLVGSALAVVASVGVAVVSLSSTRVAYVDAQTALLQAYSWSGSAWTTLGSALTVGSIGSPAMATLTASSLVFIDSSNINLRTYAFSGSVWSFVASALVTGAPGTPAVAQLTTSRIAFIDNTNDQLKTYSWSGSVWSAVGSALDVAVTGTPALAALTASSIALFDSGADTLSTYAWSGSVWSAVGSALAITGAGVGAIAALSSTQIAHMDGTRDTLQSYTWNGATWSAIGPGVNFTAGVLAMCSLNNSDIAVADVATDLLRTYRGNTSLTSVETITYDADVMLKFFTSTSRRYWQVLVTGMTTGSYIEVGRVWLGTYFTINPSSLVDFRVTKKRSDTVVYGKHRQKFADPGYGWRRFDLSFPDTDSSMLTQIETMYDTAGNHTSMIFANFDDDWTWDLVAPCYVSIQGDLQFTNRGSNRARWAMSLEEDR